MLKVEKDKHNESVSTVEAVYIRDITFPSFAFQINSSALTELLLNDEPSKKAKGNEAWNPYFDITEEIHRRVLSKVFPTSETLLRRGQFEDALREVYGEEGLDLTTGLISLSNSCAINA